MLFVYLNQICFGVRLFWRRSEDLGVIHLFGNGSRGIGGPSGGEADFGICPLAAGLGTGLSLYVVETLS